MSVKGIFKILLGVVVVLVFGTLMVEFMNMNNASATLVRIQKMAASNAAELFAQETYKNNGASIGDIVTTDGTTYVTSNFYTGSNKDEIWRNIYGNSKFEQFRDDVTRQKGSSWDTLDILERAIHQKVLGWTVPFTGGSNIENYRKNSSINRYAQGLYTPINAGIPYIDKDVATRIFRWNLAQLLSNCNKDNIRKDDWGSYYVNYNGFACYADSAYITSVTYKVYNLNTNEGKRDFEKLTGLKADNLTYSNISSTMGIDSNEQKFVIVASIEYSMPVTYLGITPFGNVIRFANNRVDGTGDNVPVSGNNTFNPNIDNLSGGGDSNFNRLTNGSGQRMTSGNLVFYIIK